MNRERSGDTNNVNINDGDVAPTEPVLPFFSLPDMPTTIPSTHNRLKGVGSTNFGYQDRAANTSRNNGYQDGGFVFNIGYRDSIVDHKNGYQDNRNVNFSDGAGTSQNNGYQDSGICSHNGYRDSGIGSNNGYQDSGIVVMNNMYQGIEKKRLDELVNGCEMRANNNITPAMSIDCFIGNQQQLLNQNLQQLGENNLSTDDDIIHPQPPSVESTNSENDHEQASEFSFYYDAFSFFFFF